jgi:dTDP-4-dehydrorhamnose 3,5-epimerase-like enzyme
MDIKLIQLQKHGDERGRLVALEEEKNIPFPIKRVYYMFETTAGVRRGFHAHKKLQQFLIALSGSFDVILNDGKEVKTITLNKPFEGLLITNEIWRELKNFSSGAVCLVIASDVFSEDDYIREFQDFLESKV